MPRDPLREALAVWVCVLAGLAALALFGRAVPILGQLTSAAAVAAFLVVPTRLLERRGQEPRDAGLRFDRVGRDAAWAVAVCAVVLPPFAFTFVHFVDLLPRLPPGVRRWPAPHTAPAPALPLPSP